MNLLTLCRERFSARKFTGEAVSPDDLTYIMECVRLAPSAVNHQPWHRIVVKSEAAKQKLRECYPREWFASAPMYVIGMKSVSDNWVRQQDGKAHGDVDVAIATEHLCLAATERGLATCWVCNFDVEKIQQYFSRPDHEAVVIVPIGHAAPDCPHAEKKRKALTDIIEEL